MSTSDSGSAAAIAEDFRAEMEGRLDTAAIEAAAAKITAASGKYGAKGSVASAIFYLKWQVRIDGGKTFDGDSGGISTPGGGALFGDVYTDDLERLYRDTRSFQFNAAAVYTSLLFFDGNANLLGHFESGSVSTVAGVGGGSGRWK